MSATEPGAATGADPSDTTRPLAMVGRFLSGISSERDNLGGRRLFWWSWALQAGLVLFIVLLDAQARLHQAALNNLIDPAWRALTDELSSGVLIILAFPAFYRMARAFPPRNLRIGRFLGVHALAILVFWLIHVSGFVAIRMVIYGLFGDLYRFGFGGYVYELPRDAMAYAIMVGSAWGAFMILQAQPVHASPARVTFDIRDNGRVVRAPVEDILAVQSAGNYVEFWLADGRRLLMRATLAEMEKQLGPHGLVRTHRSWLVNKARVTGIDPAGSGDFKLSLPAGVQAPLSRRFRGALEA